jgi:hypothetical protein
MNCDTFIDRLGDLLEGRLSADECRAASEHLRGCARCRELHMLAHEGPGDLAIEPPPGLTEAILERTSGSTCDAARGQICDHVDRVLKPVDAELVQMHIEGCADCAALARVLACLSEDLPALAELQPDDRFVSDVLARTLPRRRRLARRVAGLAVGWQGLLERPRIAWEGAYIGTIILMLIFGTPNSPLAGVPERVLELARDNPIAEMKEPLAELRPRATSAVRSWWRDASERVVDDSRALAADLTELASARVEIIKTELGTIWDRLESEESKDDTHEQSNDDTHGSADDTDRDEGEER